MPYLRPCIANVFASCCVSDAPILILSGTVSEVKLKCNSTPEWLPRREKKSISVLCSDEASMYKVVLFGDSRIGLETEIQ